MTPTEVVREHCAAFTACDLPRFLATITPSAYFTTSGTLVAPEDFASFFGGAMEAFAPRLEPQQMLADGDTVACRLLETVRVEGREEQHDKVGWFVVEGDQIAWAKIYWEADSGVVSSE